MGEFFCRAVVGDRELARWSAKNTLAYEGVEYLLRRLFPTLLTAPTYVVGLTGCNLKSPSTRPNPPSAGAVGIPADPLAEFADWVDGEANEGGAYSSGMRASFNYARQSVGFSVSALGDGAILRVAEKTWSNPHLWSPQPEADWDDPDTPTEIEQAPPEWVTRQPFEPEVGYPWHRPRKLCAPIGGADPPPEATPAYFEAWTPDGSDNWLCDLRATGGFPITGAFIADSSRSKLIALATFRHPFFLRPGSTLHVAYRARTMSWQPAAGFCTAAFAHRFAAAAFAGGSTYDAWYVRPVLSSFSGGSRRTTYADVAAHFSPDFLGIPISTWSFVPYSTGPTVLPHVKPTTSPLNWTNPTGGDVSFGSVAVYGAVGAGFELAWLTPTDGGPAELAAGDTLRIVQGPKFYALDV